ncbi:MAG: hypothetical protein M1833_000292 [Piccolia ochrophora]|nr:MAG: hypothetical protein M1833_000292 [Piccolia ochrophora]
MPPKGSKKKSQPSTTTTTTTKSSTKRKSPPPSTTSPPPSKTPRRSNRNPTPTATQMLHLLLSHTGTLLSTPASEHAFLSQTTQSPTPTTPVTFSTVPLPAYTALLSATILSRPISHALGRRAIRTLLNPPYSFTEPANVLANNDGEARVHEALAVARTQHKAKTAAEVCGLARVVVDEWEGDVRLDKVRERAGRDVGAERALLKRSVKGLGPTGLDIFFRRVQAQWAEAYPFVDERTRKALEGLGLVGTAEGVRDLVEGEWDGIKEEEGRVWGKDGEEDEEARKREVFVRAVEAAVGIGLEGKVEEARREAVKL